MRFITGDECGLVKEVCPIRPTAAAGAGGGPSTAAGKVPGTARVYRIADASGVGQQQQQRDGDASSSSLCMDRRRGVVDLTWAGSSPSPGGGGDSDSSSNRRGTFFACLRMDGTVRLWESKGSSNDNGSSTGTKYRRVAELSNISASSNSESKEGDDSDSGSSSSSSSSPSANDALLFSQPLALEDLSSTTADCLRLCACNGAGDVSILGGNYSGQQEMSVVKRFNMFDENGKKNADTVAMKQQQMYPLISAMAVNRRNGWVALGGKDRETVLHDVESGKSLWKAKNLPPNPQTLLQPLVWPTSILFLDGVNSSVVGGGGGNVMAVGTAHQQVRIYDVRADERQQQRRPILCTPEGAIVQHKVTALCQLDAAHLAVGDAAGYVHSVDMRILHSPKDAVFVSTSKDYSDTRHAMAKQSGRFVGPTGSVRRIVKHSTLPRLAVVGLDRMLRIYDTRSRKQLHCIYLKQRLNCALFADDGFSDDDEGGSEDGDDDDVDQDDVVEDYVDSENENSSDNDDDGSDSSENEATSVSLPRKRRKGCKMR